jgi:hypothetical protein
MAERFLDLGDIGFMREEGVRRRRGPQRMNPK